MSENELKLLMSKLLERFEDERGENARERAENAKFRDETRARFDKIDETLLRHTERIARLEGRIEEQSKILQLALAARLSRKPAA